MPRAEAARLDRRVPTTTETKPAAISTARRSFDRETDDLGSVQFGVFRSVTGTTTLLTSGRLTSIAILVLTS